LPYSFVYFKRQQDSPQCWQLNHGLCQKMYLQPVSPI